MKKNRVQKGYLCGVSLLLFISLGFSWLWFLANASSLEINDSNQKIIKLADFFGGQQLLLEWNQALSYLAIASWVIFFGIIVLSSYNFLCFRQAGRALNDFLHLIPSMPDEESTLALANYGIEIKEGKLAIANKYFKYANPVALSRTLTHLLYLYSRENQATLISGEHTIFHDLAKLLMLNSDARSTLIFLEVMKSEKTFLGELLESALVRINLEEELAELQGEINRVIKRETLALDMAKISLYEVADRIKRITPVEPIIAQESWLSKLDVKKAIDGLKTKVGGIIFSKEKDVSDLS